MDNSVYQHWDGYTNSLMSSTFIIVENSIFTVEYNSFTVEFNSFTVLIQ